MNIYAKTQITTSSKLLLLAVSAVASFAFVFFAAPQASAAVEENSQNIPDNVIYPTGNPGNDMECVNADTGVTHGHGQNAWITPSGDSLSTNTFTIEQGTSSVSLKANIRSCNAIAHVVRAFEDPDIQGDNNPKEAIEIIETELILADLQTIENRLPRLEKEARANPKLKPEVAAVTEIKSALNQGQPANSVAEKVSEQAWDWCKKELQLLSMKPVIYVFNVDENTLADDAVKQKLIQLVEPAQSIFVCAKLESELQGLDESDCQELLESYGVNSSGLEQLIYAAYDTLGLQSYLTAGDKEVRAWTVAKNATAPQAAGVIHGDFERGFIAADIVSYSDLIQAGSLAQARSLGKVRTEGKTYVMQPDDVVEFKFNV